MKTQPRPGKAVFFLFLLPEALIYLYFMTADAMNLPIDTMPVKYAGILLCLAFAWQAALRSLKTADGREKLLTALALSFTALADYNLIFTLNNVAGLAWFILAQACHALRLRLCGGKWRLPLRLAALALTIGILFLLKAQNDTVSCMAAVYFSVLLSNCVQAFSDGPKLFALGLLLFIGCDVCVGFFNLDLRLPAAAENFAAIGMWLFYLPSQVLIALSTACAGLQGEHDEKK